MVLVSTLCSKPHATPHITRMSEEWWNDESEEGNTWLVGRMAMCVSGLQHDAFNGGRLQSQTSEPSEHGRLHELLNYFVPILVPHLRVEKQY